MRLLQRLLQAILFLLVFCIGLDRVLGGLWHIQAHPVLARIPGLGYWLSADSGFHFRIFWLGLTLIPVLYLLVTVALWRRRPGVIHVQTHDGEKIDLDPAALTKFARIQIENHPAVVSQKASVRQSGSDSIAIAARVSVRPIQSLPAIRAGLEKAVRNGFSQVMGIDKIDEVKIVIGLDERSLGDRPGIEDRPEPRPEPPLRATYGSSVPLSSAPPTPAPAPSLSSSPAFGHLGEMTSTGINFEPATPDPEHVVPLSAEEADQLKS